MSKHTDLIHLGRDPKSQHGVVNPPVYHASTILYPNIAAFKHRAAGDRKYRGVRYGAYGTPLDLCQINPFQHTGGVYRVSGLANFRGAGYSGYCCGRASKGCVNIDG